MAGKVFLFGITTGLAFSPFQVQGTSSINNSTLVPPVLSAEQVKMEGMSPDWVKTLILAELRIETVTPEGTFAAAVRVLDHYAEMGVNGLWIDPVYERDPNGIFNGYTNFGLHTLDPKLSGKTTPVESIAEVRRFVEEAHQRNIRIFFDVIVWGTSKNAPLLQEHPEFYCRENGRFVDCWGGYKFNWDNPALAEWYTEAAVSFIDKTGADGYRVDLAPDLTGYFFKGIREELYRRGHKIALISELPSEPNGVFDFAQIGVNGWSEPMASPEKNRERYHEQIKRFGSFHASEFIFRTNNVVASIKTGTGIGLLDLQKKGEGGNFRFYSVSPVCHDGVRPFVKGSRVRFGYMLLTPFIPMWWIGEEWNNPYDPFFKKGIAIYFNNINWELKEQSPENKAFFEDVKKYIRVRRTYPEIFECFPERTRDANILELAVTRDGEPSLLQAYMRYSSDKAVLVVPNYQSAVPQSTFSISPDFRALGFSRAAEYRLTDLMSGKILASGTASELNVFKTVIPAEHLGVYLLEKK